MWNYWVNNYLMGNAPPAFDILYWNNDTTRPPARFHGQLLEIIAKGPLLRPGGMEVLGTPIDLGQVGCDKTFDSRRKDIDALAAANDAALHGVQNLAHVQAEILKSTLTQVQALVHRSRRSKGDAQSAPTSRQALKQAVQRH